MLDGTFFRKALNTGLATTFLLGASSTAEAGDAPMIESVLATARPSVPRTLKLSCMVSGASTAASATCPVIKWQGRSFWIFSFVDNRSAMAIVEHGSDGQAVMQVVKAGARYPWKASVDVATKSITISGQGNATVSMSWDELMAAQSPVVVDIPTASAPALPSGLKLACMSSSSSIAAAATCPVLHWGSYRYWALSYTDNRAAMAIVAFDSAGRAAMRWERSGARYVWDITVSGAIATFWGQGTGSVTMTQNDLRSSGP